MQRILIPLFFVLTYLSNAQIQSQIYVDGVVNEKARFVDSLQLSNHINELQIKWLNQGFYFTGIDSIKQYDSTTSIFLHKGEKLKANIEALKGNRLHEQISRKLKSYSNAGYPFAHMTLDSLTYSSNVLNGKIQIQSGPEISYDSAYFFSDLRTNHSFIYQLLDLVPGDAFREKDYKLISRKIERSPFLSIQRPADLSFKNNQAKTFLDINEDVFSSFQGVVGLQQVQNGKTTAVGSLELDLQNLFRSGKQFKFAWERFAEESQSLNVYYKHPFFLASKISPSISFDLLKQDTTFLSRKTGLGIHTYVAPKMELLLAYEATNGTLLSSEIETIRNTNLADFKRKIYSLEISEGHLSALSTLNQEMAWRVSLSGGTKNVERNLNLPDIYYDSIRLETNFYRFEVDFGYQLRIKKRQALYHRIVAGTLQNDELLQNELYRLGGLNSLRGFNEKEFFAKSYLLSRTEFRSFFENNSFAYIFYDKLFFSQEFQSDQPFGLGLGFALATSVGQFSFALAVGHSEDQQISFSTMKAHFGYISKF